MSECPTEIDGYDFEKFLSANYYKFAAECDWNSKNSKKKTYETCLLKKNSWFFLKIDFFPKP